MPDLNAIYQEKNVQYEALISREDYLGNLPATLNQITPFLGKVVIDTGAGTGRLSRMLLPLVNRDRVEAGSPEAFRKLGLAHSQESLK